MWGSPAGVGGSRVRGNKFNTSGAWRGRGVVYFIRWVDASRSETSGIDWRYSAGRGLVEC